MSRPTEIAGVASGIIRPAAQKWIGVAREVSPSASAGTAAAQTSAARSAAGAAPDQQRDRGGVPDPSARLHMVCMILPQKSHGETILRSRTRFAFRGEVILSRESL